MKIKQGDKVKVIAGKDKGKTGLVKKVYLTKEKILVEGVNIVKRHVKPGVVSKEGGIISMEKPIHVSNAMVYSDKAERPFKIEYTMVKGKKFRKFKGTDEVLEK